MKKFLVLLCLSVLCCLFNNTKALADVNDFIPHKMIVQFEQDFSSTTPSKSFSVVIDDNYTFPNIKPVDKGTKLFLELVSVEPEAVGKRDATVMAKVAKAYFPATDKTVTVNNPKAVVKFSKYEKLDVADKAVDTSITVANHFVKNITMPARFIKGVAKNKDGDRLKSGAKEAYDSSVLSYTGKGDPLVLKTGDLATLTFYTKNTNPEANTTEQKESQPENQ